MNDIFHFWQDRLIPHIRGRTFDLQFIVQYGVLLTVAGRLYTHVQYSHAQVIVRTFNVANSIIDSTSNEITRTIFEDVFIKTYSREESSDKMSGRDGSIVDFDPGVLQPDPV